MIRALGAGFTLYLNFALPDFDPVTRELFDQIARRAGIVRAVRAENPGGAPPPRCYERNTFSRGTIDVHGFIRDHRRCEDSEPVRFVFDRQAHLYDVRARKYLGRATAAETVLPPGETALFACLPYRVTAVEASAPARIPAGADLSIRLAVRSGEATPGDHVLHIEWIDPDGRVAEHYARNALAPRGRIDMRIPLARNERTGTWIARVRDVLSGMQTETRFDVTTGDAE
jgi:hypothetical protein